MTQAGDAPVIIKIGGVALERQAESASLWSAIVAMHRARVAAGHGGVVLVHGGGKAVDRTLDRLGIVSERREGIRITTSEQIDVVVGVLGGQINKSLAAAISRADSATLGVGLCLTDAGTCEVTRTTRYAFDPGHVGEVTGGDPSFVRGLHHEGWLPVFSSVGFDRRGQALNVNADDAAAGLARVLRARSVVLLTDVEGVKNADGSIAASLDAREIEAMIASGAIAGGMVPKVRAALAASQSSGADVVIMSGDDTGNLERWTRGEPVGTRISAARGQEG